MTGSASQAMDVVYLIASRREDPREGVQGEGGARGSSPAGGWRMTGSASQAMDVVFRLLLGEKMLGRGSGGGRGSRDWAGFEGWRIHVKALWAYVFQCFEAFGGLKGSLFTDPL